MEYLVGQEVRAFIEDIAPEGGAVQNPATIRLLVRRGDGSTDEYAVGALTHDGTGAYSKKLIPAPGEEGVWAWRFETTGPVVVSEGVFSVAPSALLSGDRFQPTTGPCHLWTDEDEVTRLGYDMTDVDPGLVERCLEAASDVLFQLGGRRWPGVCDRTVRAGACTAPMIPLPEGGVVTWREPWSGWHPSGGFCGGGYAVRLLSPVVGVTEVRLDGEVLDPGSYTIRDAEWLVRTDGGVWPCEGRWWEDPPALEVDVSFGAVPPALGRLAATVLAVELMRGARNDDACRLDRRVRTITREGMTADYAMPGLAESLASGWTGIPEVDLFVQAHNPQRLQRRPRFVGL